MGYKVKIWGARGSLPSPHTPGDLEKKGLALLEAFQKTSEIEKKDLQKFIKSLPPSLFAGYGGNTPCVEVKSPQSQLIIDGGSGIRLLGYDLLKGDCGRGKGEVHLLMTHFHWDHIIGLPFFVPLFIPGNQIHVYSVQPDLEKVFQTVFQKPFFPVPLKNLGATIHYHRLNPREPRAFGDLTVTPYQLDHPDPCWGYKIEGGGKVFSHCVDTEAKRVSRAEMGPDLPLYQGVDLMIFDAQYTILESIEKIDWGHSVASIGLDIAFREKIKKMVFMHHDPASSDEKIAQAENEAKRYHLACQNEARRLNEPFEPVNWLYAQEGMEFEL